MLDKYTPEEPRRPWKWIVRACACAAAALFVYARLAGGVDLEALKSLNDNRSKAEEKDGANVREAPAEAESAASLEDYLGKITCTGCGRACLLSNPQCSVGDKQAEQAKQYYQADQDKQAQIDGESGADTAATAEEYLSKLVCNGCGRACPLTNPRCMTGMRKAQMALIEYYYMQDDESISDNERGYYGYGFDGGYGYGDSRQQPDEGESEAEANGWASM